MPQRPAWIRTGRRYILPSAVTAALEQVFDQNVKHVVVIEHSRYALLHRGMVATTRPNHILLAASGAQFIAQHELLLHEYFHVLRQWQTGDMTRLSYVLESARCGYQRNRYERDARKFAADTAGEFCRLLGSAHAERV